MSAPTAAPAVHGFKSRGHGHPGCATCGYTKGNEAQHGHSCTGKMLNVPGKMLARCYGCGRTIARSDVPIQVGWYR